MNKIKSLVLDIDEECNFKSEIIMPSKAEPGDIIDLSVKSGNLNSGDVQCSVNIN